MATEVKTTFKINPETANDFRKFCRQLGKQQSEALQLMLDFFKNSGLSPLDELGPNFITLEKRIKSRINAVVAILKDIEKTQTKPTHSMLQVLFRENPVKKGELLLEKNRSESSGDSDLNRDLMIFKKTEDELRERLSERTNDLKLVLSKVAVIRNNFGKPYLRLNISKEEYELLKSKL